MRLEKSLPYVAAAGMIAVSVGVYGCGSMKDNHCGEALYEQVKKTNVDTRETRNEMGKQNCPVLR